MIVPHSWWGNKDIMYTEVKRAAPLFFQMKNLTSPVCFLIVRKCWEIHLQWVCSKSWASKVFFITCFFSTRFFIFHVFFQFQKVFLSHIWKKTTCQDHLKMKEQQKWTPDNLPMSTFLPFDFIYSNTAFYCLCMTGSFFYTGK